MRLLAALIKVISKSPTNLSALLLCQDHLHMEINGGFVFSSNTFCVINAIKQGSVLIQNYAE